METYPHNTMPRHWTSRRGGWAAILALAVSAFALVLSEFLPLGMLPAIASEFHVDAGTAGHVVTGTGVLGAIAAPAIATRASALNRRHLLVWLSALLVTADLLAATAISFPVLVFARMLLGIAVGGFWTIGAGLASRLVPAPRPSAQPRSSPRVCPAQQS